MLRLNRRTFLSALAVGVPVGAVLASAYRGDPGERARPDALRRVVLAELEEFISWLDSNDVSGFVGEVGWPDNSDGDAAQWNALADAWFQAADRANLWVSAWATGEWWDPTYRLAMYRKSAAGAGLDTANTQASVLEEHASAPSRLRGITVAGGSFASPTIEPSSAFSNANPGTYDVDYHYDGAESFRYLGQRGIRLARLDFRWERVQPRPGQPLDETELQRLESTVEKAGSAGLQVVLDLHNYGAYYAFDGAGRGVRTAIGTPDLPSVLLVDLWQRLSARFADNPNVVAYGLMNEPADLSVAYSERVTYPPLDVSSTGWRADNDGPEVLSRDTTLTHGSSFGLRVSRTFSGHPDYGHLRVVSDDGGTAPPRDLSAGGDTLATWVYLPEETPGTGWQARHFVYGARKASDALQTTGLRPGLWTRVVGRFTSDALRDVRAIGMQIFSNDVSGNASVVLDGLTQGAQRTPAQVWEDTSQSVVEAIRTRGDQKLIAVGGYGWSRVQDWSAQHPRAWIDDPANQIRYEAHHYWDRSYGSFYARSYAAEVADAGHES